jgi:type III secretory pathway component EscS
MRRGRRSYKFTGKTHSKRAVVVFALALVTLITYLVFVYQSFQTAGQLSAYYGAVGVLAMIVAMVSLVFSITSLKEEDSFQFFPRLAVVTSLLSTLLWIGNYVQGFLRG